MLHLNSHWFVVLLSVIAFIVLDEQQLWFREELQQLLCIIHLNQRRDLRGLSKENVD